MIILTIIRPNPENEHDDTQLDDHDDGRNDFNDHDDYIVGIMVVIIIIFCVCHDHYHNHDRHYHKDHKYNDIFIIIK